jgi:hypothetical protein
MIHAETQTGPGLPKVGNPGLSEITVCKTRIAS